mmetsp:Transcript_33631/g.79377  ORF Transcript_33631/g.79377 Transcript_33631/m.79377 type:complete len:241 (-) Transcript_33631:223-945(-)
MASEESKQEEGQASLMPEMPKLDLPDKMPESFDEASTMVVKLLSPVEEISPFKLGQIQKLIEDIHEDTGKAVAPFFAMLQVVFLLAFTGYFVWGIVALCLDSPAMDCPCAEDSWIWLYALLVIVIPTFLGTIMGCIKAALMAAKIDDKVPAPFLSLPPPVTMVTLAILGIILWSGMTEECATFYESTHMQLLVLFKIQVILMMIAGVFGFITVAAQTMVLVRKYVPIGDKGEESADSKAV